MTVLIYLILGGLVFVDPTWPLGPIPKGHRFFCSCVMYQPAPCWRLRTLVYLRWHQTPMSGRLNCFWSDYCIRIFSTKMYHHCREEACGIEFVIVKRVVGNHESWHQCVWFLFVLFCFFLLTFPLWTLTFFCPVCLVFLFFLISRAGTLGAYAGAHRGAFRRGKR